MLPTKTSTCSAPAQTSTPRVSCASSLKYFNEVGLIRNANYEFTFETNCQTTTNVTINAAGEPTAVTAAGEPCFAALFVALFVAL